MRVLSGNRTASQRLCSQENGRYSEVLRLEWQGLVVLEDRSIRESLEW